MTHGIDQVPNTNPDDDNRRYYRGNDGRVQDGQYPAHPERFADPYGGSTPVHPDGPRGELKRPMDSKKTLKIAAAIGAGVMTAVVAGGAYGIYKVKDISDDLTGGSDRSISQPYNPGETNSSIDYSKVDPSTLTVDQFYDDSVYPEAYRIRWADKIVDERTKNAIPAINSLLAQGNRDPITRYVEPSINNTGQEIVTQQTIVGYIASIASTPDEGRKILAASYQSENPGLQTTMEQIGGGQKPIVGTYEVWTNNGSQLMESPVFSNRVVADYQPNGIPSKIMVLNNKLTQDKSERIVQFKEGRWITVKSITTNNPSWVTAPEAIPANQ